MKISITSPGHSPTGKYWLSWDIQPHCQTSHCSLSPLPCSLFSLAVLLVGC